MKSSEIKSLFPRFEAAASTYQDVECWSARELQNLLGYTKWENFARVINKAKEASSNAGFQVKDHFPDVRKMVPIVSARCHRHSGLPEPLIVERTGGVAVELLKTPDSEKFVSERQGNDFGTISERPQVRRPLGGTDK